MRIVFAVLLFASLIDCASAQDSVETYIMTGTFVSTGGQQQIIINADNSYIMSYAVHGKIWIPTRTLSVGTWTQDSLCVLLRSDPTLGGLYLDGRVEEQAGPSDRAIIRIHSPHELLLSSKKATLTDSRTTISSYNHLRLLYEYIAYLYIGNDEITYRVHDPIITIEISSDQMIQAIAITIVPNPISFIYSSSPSFHIVYTPESPQSRIFDVYLDNFTTYYAWYRRYYDECLLIRNIDTVELRGVRYDRVASSEER
jgi:hypothetical protein